MPAAARKLVTPALVVLLGAASVCAGSFSGSSVGTSSGKFLSFGTSARAAAMGEAYCAAPQDADAIRYNPAAMAKVEANSMQFMHANYLADTSLDHAAFVRRLSPSQAIGISALRMSYGSITKTDEAGYETGTAHPANLALTGAFSYKFDGLGALLDGSAAGFSASYIRSAIVSSAKTFTVSLGLLSPAYGPYETQIGVVAENLVGTLKFDQKADPLPMVFRLGGLMHIQPELSLALELAGPRDNAPYAALGMEKWFAVRPGTRFAVRGGYNMLPGKDTGGLAGFTTGIGLYFNGVTLDYALVPFGAPGYAHKLALGFSFGEGGGDDYTAAETRPYYSYASRDLEEPEPDAAAEEAEPPDQTQAGPENSGENDYQYYIELAEDYVLNKRYATAAGNYRKARESLPANDERRVFVYEQQGRISLKLGSLSRAKDFFLAAIVTAKELRVSGAVVVNAYLGLAYCFERSGSVVSAVRNYEKALELSANDNTKMRIRNVIQKLKARS